MTKRILVVEDDVFIAMDIAERLETMGFEVLGPCINTASALELFEADPCDVALLDINLGSETSEAVAVILKSNGVPFVVASGYSPEQYPPIYAGAAALPKPVQNDALKAALLAA